MDFCPKMKITAWLEFEPVYFETAVQHVIQFAINTPPLPFVCNDDFKIKSEMFLLI